MAQGFYVSTTLGSRQIILGVGFASCQIPAIRAAKPAGWQPQATVGWVIPAHKQMLRQPNDSLVGANAGIMVKDLARVD